MYKSLIFKALAIVLAIVLLQLADTSESKAWGGDCGGGGTHYVVCYGDTLFSIGRQFNVNPYCVAQANGLWDPNYIYAGQVLYIPQNCHPYPWPGHYPHGGYPGGGYPSHYPCGGYDCNQGCGGNDCQWQSNWKGCGNDCYRQGAGYDYTGYYYDGYNNYGNQRYSHTCGYYNNCY
jgi:LysM repeat protein